MSGLLLRNTGRTLNIFLRPQSTLTTSSLAYRTSLIKKSAVLVSNRLKTAPMANSLIRASSTAAEHSASKHWSNERYLAMALIPIIPAGILLENPIADYMLATALVLHSHWGLNVIVTDYVHGATLPKVAKAAVALTSLAALLGLFYFNYADVGLAKGIKKLWSL